MPGDAAGGPAPGDPTSLLFFAHLCDPQIGDVQSPGRFEFFEAISDVPEAELFILRRDPRRRSTCAPSKRSCARSTALAKVLRVARPSRCPERRRQPRQRPRQRARLVPHPDDRGRDRPALGRRPYDGLRFFWPTRHPDGRSAFVNVMARLAHRHLARAQPGGRSGGHADDPLDRGSRWPQHVGREPIASRRQQRLAWPA